MSMIYLLLSLFRIHHCLRRFARVLLLRAWQSQAARLAATKERLGRSFSASASRSSTSNRCIVGNEQDGEQNDTEDQVRYCSWDELACGTAKGELRDPDISISGKSNANNDTDSTENLRNSDRTRITVAPKDVEQAKTCKT